MPFPTLFLNRKINWFNQEHRVEVLLTEYNKHMLKYAMKNHKCHDDELGIKYLFPFVGHDRCFFGRNILMSYIPRLILKSK